MDPTVLVILFLVGMVLLRLVIRYVLHRAVDKAGDAIDRKIVEHKNANHPAEPVRLADLYPELAESLRNGSPGLPAQEAGNHPEPAYEDRPVYEPEYNPEYEPADEAEYEPEPEPEESRIAGEESGLEAAFGQEEAEITGTPDRPEEPEDETTLEPAETTDRNAPLPLDENEWELIEEDREYPPETDEEHKNPRWILLASVAIAVIAAVIGILLLSGVIPGSNSNEADDWMTQADYGDWENHYLDELTVTPEPTQAPTEAPTDTPEPTQAPTEAPTDTPEPTQAPIEAPTDTPELTQAPTEAPTDTPEPTQAPTEVPTDTPEPTQAPTEVPTDTPEPTQTPTEVPTDTPAPAAVSQASRFPVQAVSTVRKVNVRSMPDINSRRVGVVQTAGTSVTILDETADSSGTRWYSVRLQDGTEGYMMAEYLQEAGKSLPAESTAFPETAAQSSSGAEGLYGLAVQELVTRNGPGNAFDETGTYDLMGQQVKILARAHDALSGTWWVKCEIPVNGEIRILWTNYFRFDSASLPLKSIPLE